MSQIIKDFKTLNSNDEKLQQTLISKSNEVDVHHQQHHQQQQQQQQQYKPTNSDQNKITGLEKSNNDSKQLLKNNLNTTNINYSNINTAKPLSSLPQSSSKLNLKNNNSQQQAAR
jgi:hypothetical protein